MILPKIYHWLSDWCLLIVLEDILRAYFYHPLPIIATGYKILVMMMI